MFSLQEYWSPEMTVLVDKGRVFAKAEGHRHEQIDEIMVRVAEAVSRLRAHSGFLLVESSFKGNTRAKTAYDHYITDTTEVWKIWKMLRDLKWGEISTEGETPT
jgi:hypothetical protein